MQVETFKTKEDLNTFLARVDDEQIIFVNEAKEGFFVVYKKPEPKTILNAIMKYLNR